MEDDIVVIAVLCMGHEILHCFGGGIRKESYMYITIGSMYDCSSSGFSSFRLRLFPVVDVTWLLVLNVSVCFADAAGMLVLVLDILACSLTLVRW